jgi:4-hydroxyphenylacetate 3-monooxygenase
MVAVADQPGELSMPEAANGHFRPFTGDEYIESLRDGRTVYLHGEKVRDVTTHPAFRNSVRSVARMYDALHDPDMQSTLMCETDTGSGGLTHKFFRVPHSSEDLIGARDAIVGWQRLVYGWLGRSPDYKASFLATLGAIPEYFGDYEDNAHSWYRRSQEEVSYWNHAIIHPPVDRHLGADRTGEVCMHVEEENDNGVVVSGAKVVATGSLLTHYNFIAHFGPIPIQTREYAIVCATAMDTPGVKLICRNSYELQAATTGSPFDYPLSSRLDENDSILVFDKVLIPWENVFLYGDVDKANTFFSSIGFGPRYMFHGLARMCVKLDFLAGLLSKALRATGARDFRGVQANLGEVIAIRNLMWGLSDAACKSPDPWANGAVQPSAEYAMAYRTFAPMFYPRIKEITQQVVASGLIYVNSNAADFKSAEIRPYLDKYVRGSNGIDSVERVKIMKLLWDATASEFGGRHELYERNYGGGNEQIKYENLFAADRSGLTDRLEGFVDECMAEYDLDGWTTDDFVNPGDVSVIGNDWD